MEKLEWCGYRWWKKNFEDMLIHFDMIHERDRQTDRQTDIRTLHDSIDRALYIASRGKNEKKRSKVVQWRRGWGGNVHLSHLLMSFLLSTWRLNCLRHMCSIGYITKISTSAFDGCVFIARQHTDAQICLLVCPSVRPIRPGILCKRLNTLS